MSLKLPGTGSPSTSPTAAFHVPAGAGLASGIYVLTSGGRYHRLDPGARRWKKSAPTASLLNASIVGDGPIHNAMTLPGNLFGRPAHEVSVYLFTSGGGQVKHWSFIHQGGGRFKVHASTPSVCKPGSTGSCRPPKGSEAPSSWADIRAGWRDTDNSRGWASGDPTMICATAKNKKVTDFQGAFVGSGTTTRIHYQETAPENGCYAFFKKTTYSRWTRDFGLSRAPKDPGGIGAATWYDGELWLFRGK